MEKKELEIEEQSVHVLLFFLQLNHFCHTFVWVTSFQQKKVHKTSFFRGIFTVIDSTKNYYFCRRLLQPLRSNSLNYYKNGYPEEFYREPTLRVFGNVPGRSDTERRLVCLIVTMNFSSCVRNKLLTARNLKLIIFV